MKKILLLAAGIVMVLSSFAVGKPMPILEKKSLLTKSFTCTRSFMFTGSPGQENDPTKYQDITPTDPATTSPCLTGTTKLCGLCISSTSLVYTQDEADEFDDDVIVDEWVGQPKVDISPNNTLDDEIAASLGVGQLLNHTYSGTNVTIVKKN